MASTELPGTPEHRGVLRGVAAHDANDPRILAVALFGSLARGTWDAHSDLDLAVVVADGVTVDPIDEVRRLCRALGQEPITVEPDGGDAVDVVLPSLVELSIQYRPLAATTPFADDGVLMLAGGLDARTIEAAGRARRETVSCHGGEAMHEVHNGRCATVAPPPRRSRVECVQKGVAGHE